MANVGGLIVLFIFEFLVTLLGLVMCSPRAFFYLDTDHLRCECICVQAGFPLVRAAVRQHDASAA